MSLLNPIRPSLLANSASAIADSDVLVIDGPSGVRKVPMPVVKTYMGIDAGQPDGLSLIAQTELIKIKAITRSEDDVIVSATVLWPDGSAGVFTVTDVNDDLINAYTITHANSGRTITQPFITRDAESGAILNIPDMTISL